jgi:hypothetical protein
MSILKIRGDAKDLFAHKASEGSDGAGKGSLFLKAGARLGRCSPAAGAIRVQTRRIQDAQGKPILSREVKDKEGNIIRSAGEEQWQTEATIGFLVADKTDPDEGKVTYLRLQLDGDEYVSVGDGSWQPRIYRLFDLVEATAGVTADDATHAGFKKGVIGLLTSTAVAQALEKAAGDFEKTSKIYAQIDAKIAEMLRSILQPKGKSPEQFPAVNLYVAGRAYFKGGRPDLSKSEGELIPLVQATSVVIYTPSHKAFAKATGPGSSPLEDQRPLETLAKSLIERERKSAARRAERDGGISVPVSGGGGGAPSPEVTAASSTIGDDLFA